jgi:hypothetical protein
VDQQPFEDVGMPTQMRAAHPAGVVHMSEGALQVLPAAPQEPLASRSVDAPAIAVDWS